MPITKQYLRYSPSGTFNIITSPNCNCTWTTVNNQDGRFICTGTCETLTVWDVQLGEKAIVFQGDKSEVTSLCTSPSKKYIVGGYKDGSVKVFNLLTCENVITFSGHKRAVTCLTCDTLGHRLASGSKDNQIILWDMVAETGVARLSSHTAPVTQIQFMSTQNVLISSSKDTSIKFWDLDTNHCFKTLLGHRTEVWGFAIVRDDHFLVTGCSDSELRVWQLQYKEIYRLLDKENVAEIDYGNQLSPIECIKMGSILRSGVGRVCGIAIEADGSILAAHGVNDNLELFKFLPHLEALRRMRKRKKKEKKKQPENELETECETEKPILQDYVRRLPSIKTKSKIKSTSLVLDKGGELRVAICLGNNTLQVYNLDTNAHTDASAGLVRSVAQQGHHSEVRSLTFSSDNLAIASGSAESVKIWNRPSLSCIRTIACGYVLSLVFVPGDRHALASLKDGRILILDVSVGAILEEIPAHTAEVWSLSLLPNQRGAVSGSSDSTLKFWDFELIKDKTENSKGKVLSLSHKRTLSVSEAVLFVRTSPDSKYIAVALLDMTIKVFFLDTFKFFLSLYGHKLPVLTMDISSDSTILVSGSADRNIKIWGLDFGDCHKSIFAHENSIMCVQFVPNTHHFFSCGKDGTIKQWDADNFNKIITLKGHFGEAWSLAVSPNGEHVVSSGSDRVLRLYTRTEEPVVLEDEEEEERAREEEEHTLTEGETSVKGKGDLNLPSKKTVGSEKAAELLIECLDIIKERNENPDSKIHPLMVAYEVNTNHDFLIETLKCIRASDLEEALLLLPFPTVCDMLEIFPSLIKIGTDIELVTKTLLFLLKIHHGPIVSSQTLLPMLLSVQKLVFDRVNEFRDLIGSNLYGMQFIQRRIEQQEGVQLFRDATIERREKVKKRKRKEKALKRAVLAL